MRDDKTVLENALCNDARSFCNAVNAFCSDAGPIFSLNSASALMRDWFSVL